MSTERISSRRPPNGHGRNDLDKSSFQTKSGQFVRWGEATPEQVQNRLPDPDPAEARLDILRRSVVLAPTQSPVTLSREDVIDLLTLVLKQAATSRRAEN